MDDEAYEVSSELYEERDYTSQSKPIVNPTNVVSEFSFKLPGYSIEDSDGDLIVPRKQSEQNEHIEIEHSYSTSLNLVGLQVWRGALLLADWLLHNGRTIKKDEYILEVGSGVGLTSIVASMFSRVICTDVDRADILELMRANVIRNKHVTRHPVEVVELDFMSATVPEKIAALLPKVSIVLAADVVYDDTLTEAFVQTVKRLLDFPAAERSIYVALEKRYVFSLSDCDTCAPCYDYFLEQINSLKNVTVEEVKLDFPQYFQYDRCKELVLWKIKSKL